MPYEKWVSTHRRRAISALDMNVFAAEGGCAPTFSHAARRCVVRVRAALRAACRRPVLPFVRTALSAARWRDLLVRRRAARRACCERLLREAAERPFLRNAREVARERRTEVLRRRADLPRRTSRCAFVRVSAEAVPLLGGGNFTPARRALDSPIAIACCGEAAPCLPSRMWCISSRINSPAWVEGDFPSRASSRARSNVSFSGIDSP